MQRLVHISGFSIEPLPFKYLGMPIYARKIPATESRKLVEKMTCKIKQWSSKQLSYACTIVLIDSVLLAINAYWAQLFPFPKKMIKDLAGVCRAFLWKSKVDSEGPGFISWDNLCRSRAERGLGFQRYR